MSLTQFDDGIHFEDPTSTGVGLREPVAAMFPNRVVDLQWPNQRGALPGGLRRRRCGTHLLEHRIEDDFQAAYRTAIHHVGARQAFTVPLTYARTTGGTRPRHYWKSQLVRGRAHLSPMLAILVAALPLLTCCALIDSMRQRLWRLGGGLSRLLSLPAPKLFNARLRHHSMTSSLIAVPCTHDCTDDQKVSRSPRPIFYGS